MCQMWWKGLGPYGGRLLDGNEICELPTKSPRLHKILQNLQKKKKKKKKILKVKHKRNVSFLEARKIVGIYMGENSYV